MDDRKDFLDSLEALRNALKHEKEAKNSKLIAAGIAKLFETCFEYAWKLLKQEVNKSGIEAYSPRDTIKAAGRTGVLGDVELWLGFLEDRNLSMHDYIGISNDEYLKTIKAFVIEAGKL